MGLYGNPELTGVETYFDDDEIIVTKTDLTGKITYGNRVFYRLAGYTEQECLGAQHNIIRHPEMPRVVFKLLWDVLAQGQEVFAYVNNRSKNGDNYWVFAHVTPSFDMDGNIISYHSNRRVPNRAAVDKIIPIYKQLLEIEQSADSPKQGMEKALETLMGVVGDSGLEFNELMFALGD